MTGFETYRSLIQRFNRYAANSAHDIENIIFLRNGVILNQSVRFKKLCHHFKLILKLAENTERYFYNNERKIPAHNHF